MIRISLRNMYNMPPSLFCFSSSARGMQEGGQKYGGIWREMDGRVHTPPRHIDGWCCSAVALGDDFFNQATSARSFDSVLHCLTFLDSNDRSAVSASCSGCGAASQTLDNARVRAYLLSLGVNQCLIDAVLYGADDADRAHRALPYIDGILYGADDA